LMMNSLRFAFKLLIELFVIIDTRDFTHPLVTLIIAGVIFSLGILVGLMIS